MFVLLYDEWKKQYIIFGAAESNLFDLCASSRSGWRNIRFDADDVNKSFAPENGLMTERSMYIIVGLEIPTRQYEGTAVSIGTIGDRSIDEYQVRLPVQATRRCSEKEA